MIISASRRTDIPAFYSKWLMNRIRAGWCQVPNPSNLHQISYVSLRPEDVDAIVFWTKNPKPLFENLDELDWLQYRYYFQFTLNDYPKELEPDIPSFEERVHAFIDLSQRLRPTRVVWRYDPIIISNETSPEFHVRKFSKIAEALSGFTTRVMVSFVDFYQKTSRQLSPLEKSGFRFDALFDKSPDAFDLMRELAEVARFHKIQIFTCSEECDFSRVGAAPGRCIDGDLLCRLWSLQGHDRKDPSQRVECLCAVSKDIGINDTCIHGCPYCYATRNIYLAKRRFSEHDPNSPLIWGNPRLLSEKEQANDFKAKLI